MADTTAERETKAAVETEKARQQLINETTKSVMASLKSAKEQITSVSGTNKKAVPKTYRAKEAHVIRFQKRGGGSEKPPEAGPNLQSETKLSKGQYDVAPKGNKLIVGERGTPLADAPSVGANVNARLKRLQAKIERDIFKKDTGSTNPKLQDVVSGLNVRTRSRSQPGAFERGTETVQQYGAGGQDIVYPAAAMTKKSAASSVVSSPRALRY